MDASNVGVKAVQAPSRGMGPRPLGVGVVVRLSVVLVLGLVTGLGLAACGGGGGGNSGLDLPPAIPPENEPESTPPEVPASEVRRNDLLSGTYQVVGLQASEVATAAMSTFGTLTADGQGLYTPAWRTNTEGVVSVRTTGTTFAYDARGDGSLTLGLLKGAVAMDGRYAILSSQGAGQTPTILVLLRRDLGAATTILEGAFSYAALSTRLSGVAPFRTAVRTGFGDPCVAAIDAPGLGTFDYPNVQMAVWEDGVFGGTTVSAPGQTWTYLGSGDMLVGAHDGSTAEGVVGAGGTFFFGATGPTPGSAPTLVGAMREAPVLMTDPQFVGDFWMVELGADPSGTRRPWSSSFLTLTLDGLGTARYSEAAVNTEGVLSTRTAAASAYSLGGTNSLVLGTLQPGLVTRVARITPDGAFGFAAARGPGTLGEGSSYTVLIRK